MSNNPILIFLEFLGALGIFVYGMKTMSEGLQKISGAGLRRLMESITSNAYLAVFVGFFTTVLIQSSTATTVFVVSFVNAGMLQLSQAIGIILGANIGTTATSWVVAMVGLKISLPKLVLPLLGLVFPFVFSGIKKLRSVGEFLVGLSLFVIGLGLMQDALPDLSQNESLHYLLKKYSQQTTFNLALFTLIGVVVTIVTQSSTATMGLVLVLVSSGIIDIYMAIGMILGEDIGTTITANLAAIVANREAKRAALSHFLVNFFAVILVFVFYMPFIHLINFLFNVLFSNNYVFAEMSLSEMSRHGPVILALLHSTFNILQALLFVNSIPLLVKFLKVLIPEKEQESEFNSLILGDGLIETPGLALMEARKSVFRLSERMFKNYKLLEGLLVNKNLDEEKLSAAIRKKCKRHGVFIVEIERFLKGISHTNVSGKLVDENLNYLDVLRNLDKINDGIVNLSLSLNEKNASNIAFKKNMEKGVLRLFELVKEAFELTIYSLQIEKNEMTLREIDELERRMSELHDELRLIIYERVLKKNKDSIESSILYQTVYTYLERIGDNVHTVNDTLYRLGKMG